MLEAPEVTSDQGVFCLARKFLGAGLAGLGLVWRVDSSAASGLPRPDTPINVPVQLDFVHSMSRGLLLKLPRECLGPRSRASLYAIWYATPAETFLAESTALG